jgi:hypothetical protein
VIGEQQKGSTDHQAQLNLLVAYFNIEERPFPTQSTGKLF